MPFLCSLSLSFSFSLLINLCLCFPSLSLFLAFSCLYCPYCFPIFSLSLFSTFVRVHFFVISLFYLSYFNPLYRISFSLFLSGLSFLLLILTLRHSFIFLFFSSYFPTFFFFLFYTLNIYCLAFLIFFVYVPPL